MPENDTSSSRIRIEESWRAALAGEFASDYMDGLRAFLMAEKEKGKRIFPKGSEYFRAMDLRSEEHTSELQSH